MDVFHLQLRLVVFFFVKMFARIFWWNQANKCTIFIIWIAHWNHLIDCTSNDQYCLSKSKFFYQFLSNLHTPNVLYQKFISFNVKQHSLAVVCIICLQICDDLSEKKMGIVSFKSESESTLINVYEIESFSNVIGSDPIFSAQILFHNRWGKSLVWVESWSIQCHTIQTC